MLNRRLKTLPDERALERVQEIITLAEELAGDFRRVRDEFDRLNRGLREDLMESEGSRAETLELSSPVLMLSLQARKVARSRLFGDSLHSPNRMRRSKMRYRR